MQIITKIYLSVPHFIAVRECTFYFENSELKFLKIVFALYFWFLFESNRAEVLIYFSYLESSVVYFISLLKLAMISQISIPG